MDEKLRKRLMFLGTLFVAIAFISSYAAFNYSTSTVTSTTTTTATKTYFVSGTANGTVSGYSNGALVLLNRSANASVGNATVKILSGLEANGSISSYIELNNSFQVLLSTINAYSLEQLVDTGLGSNSIASVNASSYIVLPSRMTLYLNTQSVAVTLQQTNFSINLYPISPVGTKVKLKINALVAPNGTVYDNQVILSKE